MSFLTFTSKDGYKKKVEFTDEVELGRNGNSWELVTRKNGVDILSGLEDGGVSRHHAKIYYNNNKLFIQDLGSKNGTYLNEEIVIGLKEIYDSSEIRIGSTTIKLTMDKKTVEFDNSLRLCSNRFDNITIKRGYTHRGRFIRFKIKVENKSQYPIRDVKVHLSLPSTLHCESPKLPESTIGDIESGETLACEFLLKPLACTTVTVKGYIVYKDISGEIQTLTIRGKEIETCRPNLEHLPLTFADVTETISSKQLYKDSEHIRLDGINSADATPLLLKTAEWMNMHHVDDNGHDDQLIFVGRQKVEQTMVIARAALRGDGVKVRCYVEREDLVAGFLAEFSENLEELVTSSVKPSSDVIWRIMDIFEEIEDTLVYDPSKDQIFTYLNKAHEICQSVDKGISKEIAAFVDNVQMVKEHKDSLDDADITTLKQNIDSWNEVMRGKVD